MRGLHRPYGAVTRGTYAATMKAPDGASIVERGTLNTDSLPPDHQASTADGHDH